MYTGAVMEGGKEADIGAHSGYAFCRASSRGPASFHWAYLPEAIIRQVSPQDPPTLTKNSCPENTVLMGIRRGGAFTT